MVFGAAAAGLAAAGHRTLALGFGVIVVLNGVLLYVWGLCWGITIERKSQHVVSPGMDAGSSIGRKRIPFS